MKDNYQIGYKNTQVRRSIYNSYKKSYDTIPVKIKSLMQASNGLTGRLIKGDVINPLNQSNKSDISLISAELYTAFLELKQDYENGAIGKERYAAYLKIYKALIDAGLKLDEDALHVYEIAKEMGKILD